MFSIPIHSLHIMAIILSLLVIGTLCYLVISRRHPDKDHTELKLRIRSWWWMIGIVFVALYLPQNYSLLFFGFLSFMALKEFLSIVPTRMADRRVIFWAYLSIPFHYYWLAIGWYGMYIIFIPVYMFLYLPMVAVLIGDTKGFIRSAGTIHWALMLTVFCLSHMATYSCYLAKTLMLVPWACCYFCWFSLSSMTFANMSGAKRLENTKSFPRSAQTKLGKVF